MMVVMMVVMLAMPLQSRAVHTAYFFVAMLAYAFHFQRYVRYTVLL